MHWARGGKVQNDEALNDAELLGAEMPAEWVEALAEERADFGVWEENVAIVDLFMTVQTQWRSAGFGLMGLDYTAVFQVMDRMRIRDEDGDLFAGLQLMERTIVTELTKGA